MCIKLLVNIPEVKNVQKDRHIPILTTLYPVLTTIQQIAALTFAMTFMIDFTLSSVSAATEDKVRAQEANSSTHHRRVVCQNPKNQNLQAPRPVYAL